MKILEFIKLVIIYISIILIISIAYLGCSQKNRSVDQTDSEMQLSSSSVTDNGNKEMETVEHLNYIPHNTVGYSPLTYQKFIDILNGNDEFSAVYIYYHSDINYLPQGTPQDLRDLRLNAGQPGESCYIGSIDNYIGIYHHYFDYLDPPERIKQHQVFTPNQLNLIYNYLVANQTNQDYFFSNEEFIGLDDPYNSSTADIQEGYFGFTLLFHKPDSDYYAWAISKCVNDYPEFGTPLHGLFELIEDNFMSQFE